MVDLRPEIASGKDNCALSMDIHRSLKSAIIISEGLIVCWVMTA